MSSAEFTSDYLNLTITGKSDEPTIAKFFSLINEFPEGSARRLELEAQFLGYLSSHVAHLAYKVREDGKVTLYDED